MNISFRYTAFENGRYIYTMSEAVWKVAVNRNFDFQSFAICQNFRKKMNKDVPNLPDDEPSIFFDVHMHL